MYEVTASIVIYKNDSDELLKVIHSFLNTDMKVRLYLIDNSPSDDIKPLLPSDDRIEYQFVGENLGFGKAHNIALRKIQGLSPYHLILNPDIYFESDVVEQLISYMNENTNVGLITPDIFLPTGERAFSCRSLPAPSTLIKRRLFPSSVKDVYKDIVYDHPVSSPWVSGCFMMVRTSILESVGLFDERFFMYCEDVDISRRVHSCGYDIVCYPLVKAVHASHRDSAHSLKMLSIHVFSAIKYFNKWGWIFDDERERINSEMAEKLKIKS